LTRLDWERWTVRPLKEWLDEDKVILIDIREPEDEYSSEHIPGSRLVLSSAFDSADFSRDHENIGVFH
jgi:rhodanese-related sulfurtransferase